MITEQTNIDLAGMAREIKALDTFVICGHVSPDGDCIGSQLALYHALRSLGKQATCILAGTVFKEDGLMFLPGVDTLIPAQDFEDEVDAFVAVDVPTVKRIGDGAEVQARCKTTFTIDHHAVDTVMAQHNYVDPDAASTTIIIWDLIKALGVEISPDMALCTYTGLVTDTGGFQFQNTDADAFRAASEMVAVGIEPSMVARQVLQNRSLASLQLERLALERMRVSSDGSYVLSYICHEDLVQTGGEKSDIDPLVNTLRSLRGIRVACVLREQEDGVRGSIRAKDDTDVAAIARLYDGGGHKAAAGFSLFVPMDDAIQQVIASLDRALGLHAGQSTDDAQHQGVSVSQNAI